MTNLLTHHWLSQKIWHIKVYSKKASLKSLPIAESRINFRTSRLTSNLEMINCQKSYYCNSSISRITLRDQNPTFHFLYTYLVALLFFSFSIDSTIPSALLPSPKRNFQSLAKPVNSKNCLKQNWARSLKSVLRASPSEKQMMTKEAGSSFVRAFDIWIGLDTYTWLQSKSRWCIGQTIPRLPALISMESIWEDYGGATYIHPKKTSEKGKWKLHHISGHSFTLGISHTYENNSNNRKYHDTPSLLHSLIRKRRRRPSLVRWTFCLFPRRASFNYTSLLLLEI